MPSVPNEVLRDFLLPLDRWTLDRVQFTCPRFLRLITGCMSKVCLRQIENATFSGSDAYYLYRGSFLIRINGRPAQKILNAQKDIARLFSRFMQALRSSRVGSLQLNGLVFTPELAVLVLQTPIVAESLSLFMGSCAELAPAQFHKVLVHFSPTNLFVYGCHLRACQINDEFVRTLSTNRVPCTSLRGREPVDGGSFCVTDDAVVDFCIQENLQVHQEGEQLEELTLHYGSFTKDLFKRLVEASSMSMRVRPLRITVSTVRFEDEDLRDYAQHLTYSGPGCPKRIYHFCCKQHGAVTAMCLEIVLEGSELIMSRARHGSLRFYEADE
ncbi:hypothetical protein AAVH_30289 [Aphelenchoides avenae]|nr:hypothetical protein AAVH_30289 [Aphelenchus avenae]